LYWKGFKVTPSSSSGMRRSVGVKVRIETEQDLSEAATSRVSDEAVDATNQSKYSTLKEALWLEC